MKLSFRTIALIVAGLLLVATFVLAVAAYFRGPAAEGPPVEPAAERLMTPVLPGEALRIDDFEVRSVSLEAWHPMMVDGRTRADFLIAPGGATPESRHHLSADLVRPRDPAPADVAAVIARIGDTSGRDARGFSGVELWLDGSPGLYIVQLGSGRVRDHDHFNAYVEITRPGWERYRLPFDDFQQEGFGKAVEWTGRDLVHIAFFSVNPGSVTLAVDEVRFYE